MTRDRERLEKRREYVRTELNKSQSVSDGVRDLADRLFLSERTIWLDYVSTAKTDGAAY